MAERFREVGCSLITSLQGTDRRFLLLRSYLGLAGMTRKQEMAGTIGKKKCCSSSKILRIISIVGRAIVFMMVRSTDSTELADFFLLLAVPLNL